MTAWRRRGARKYVATARERAVGACRFLGQRAFSPSNERDQPHAAAANFAFFRHRESSAFPSPPSRAIREFSFFRSLRHYFSAPGSPLVSVTEEPSTTGVGRVHSPLESSLVVPALSSTSYAAVLEAQF